MPKTAVNKDGKPLFEKNEVRPPMYFIIAPPAVDFIFPEKFDHALLGAQVSMRPDS